ncbi:hypothetical protein CN509_16100 [Bacillus cereus]|nr:hypothetical protein CN509_16100 [Bacillus cereus]
MFAFSKHLFIFYKAAIRFSFYDLTKEYAIRKGAISGNLAVPYVLCVVLRIKRNAIIVLLGGQLATVRLRQVCVVLRVLCGKGVAMQLLFIYTNYRKIQI